MPYLTSYTLTAGRSADTQGKTSPEEAISYFVSLNAEAKYCLRVDGATKGNGKWYEHEDDLLTLSKEFPHLAFTLEGQGEDAGDIWKKYLLNGKVQVCNSWRYPRCALRRQERQAEITVAPFDPAKLRGA